MNGGSDPQYDHEVAVIRLGTNYSVTEPTYYPDDVVYFTITVTTLFLVNRFTSNPAIPPGAGAGFDSTGCAPYVFGYTLGSLANTRAGATARMRKPTPLSFQVMVPFRRTRAAPVMTRFPSPDLTITGSQSPVLKIRLWLRSRLRWPSSDRPLPMDCGIRSIRWPVMTTKTRRSGPVSGPELHEQPAGCTDDKLCPTGHGERSYGRYCIQPIRVPVLFSRRRGRAGCRSHYHV